MNNVTIRWVAQKNVATQHKDGTLHYSKVMGIPAGYVGATKPEAMATCVAVGCRMRPVVEGGDPDGPRCYAWQGTPSMAASSMDKAQAKRNQEPSRRYSLRKALDSTSRKIGPRCSRLRFVRVGALGDPGDVPVDNLRALREEVKAEGLDGVLGYTHGWRDRPAYKDQLLASCDKLSEVDEAVAQGWRASVVLPWDAPRKGNVTPGGVPISVCPAMLTEDRDMPVICNDCGWCDPQQPGPRAVGFLNHDKKSLGLRMRRKRDDD